MITAPVITNHTVSGRPIYTVTVTGLPAHDIEVANRSSFYGIRGNGPACGAGARAASETVSEALARSGIFCYSYSIIKTRTIDTSGTPVPYKAEIDFIIDDTVFS